MFKVNKKTPERRHWRRSGVFTGNSEYISHLILVFLLLCRLGLSINLSNLAKSQAWIL